MADERTTRSPLAARRDDLAAIGAQLLPLLAQVDLRVDPELAGRSDLPLPLEPNTAIDDGERTTLWLGPDQWLILGAPGEERPIIAEVAAALDGVHRSIVDVSANRVAIELGGAHRFELLSHVCTLDLDPPAWGVGRCAQILLGRAQVIFHERTETTGILVRPSFADYVVDLLRKARTAMDMRA
jgi:sarcosine oxidase subunit gamma